MSGEGGGSPFQKTIGIKVDVDTDVGMKRGVPVLLDLFRKYGIKVSFFVPMGKDHTGWTAKRVFTRKGFLKKAGRVGVVSTYGVKTLMYGLLLPGPVIAKNNSGLFRKIMEEGHEAGIHGLDHVHWHDRIKDMSREQTMRVLDEAFTVYRELAGTPPLSFAAPGWMINGHAIKYFDDHGVVYSSDTRGFSPFYPVFKGARYATLQVPSTLPTLDEMVGIAGTDQDALTAHFLSRVTEGLNILTVHTELEGHRWTGFLDSFIKKTLEKGYSYKMLIDIATEMRKRADTPACQIEYGQIEGRAGLVTLQQL